MSFQAMYQMLGVACLYSIAMLSKLMHQELHLLIVEDVGHSISWHCEQDSFKIRSECVFPLQSCHSAQSHIVLAIHTSTASRCQSNHHSQKCNTSLIKHHLGHDAVVCSHHQDDNIGDRRPSRAHGSEGCMPGSVQECCRGLQPQPCIALSTHTLSHVHRLAEQSAFQHFSSCRRLQVAEMHHWLALD